MLAGSKKNFAWATGDQVEYGGYFRRIAVMLKSGGRAVPSQSDCLANLLLASIIYLREVPKASKAALEAEAQHLRRLSTTGETAGSPGRAAEGATRATQTLDTPTLMRQVGWQVRQESKSVQGRGEAVLTPDSTPPTPDTPANTSQNNASSIGVSSFEAPQAPRKRAANGAGRAGKDKCAKKSKDEIDPTELLATFESWKSRCAEPRTYALRCVMVSPCAPVARVRRASQNALQALCHTPTPHPPHVRRLRARSPRGRRRLGARALLEEEQRSCHAAGAHPARPERWRPTVCGDRPAPNGTADDAQHDAPHQSSAGLSTQCRVLRRAPRGRVYARHQRGRRWPSRSDLAQLDEADRGEARGERMCCNVAASAFAVSPPAPPLPPRLPTQLQSLSPPPHTPRPAWQRRRRSPVLARKEV
eukprot:7387709-Prymnesium_polylepis.1